MKKQPKETKCPYCWKPVDGWVWTRDDDKFEPEMIFRCPNCNEYHPNYKYQYIINPLSVLMGFGVVFSIVEIVASIELPVVLVGRHWTIIAIIVMFALGGVVSFIFNRLIRKQIITFLFRNPPTNDTE